MGDSGLGFTDYCRRLRLQGNAFIKQPVKVARRTPSGTGPIVGAAATVAVLRQDQVGRPALSMSRG